MMYRVLEVVFVNGLAGPDTGYQSVNIVSV
jgi:hypothetical protein